MSIKSVLKKHLPKNILDFLQGINSYRYNFKNKLNIKKARTIQPHIVKRLKNKEKLNCIFLVIHDSVWKYEEVYRLMEKDSFFNVQIVIIPLVRNGIADLEVFTKTLSHFNKGNYNVVSSYSNQTDSWLDIKKMTQPDIVFFTNPHRLTFAKYYIYNFTNTLTCYVPYSFQVSNLFELQFNQPFHAMIWRQFYETEIHKSIGEKYSNINGVNIIVTGYPGVDQYLYGTEKFEDPWKLKNRKIKRIIWAPHHTIPGAGASLNYSSFIQYSNFMLEYAKKNQDVIQMAFKPHPLLKNNLYKNRDWGIKKTEDYYSKWAEMENTFIHDSEYSSLFYFSDALVHDSGSFSAEYLALNKPVMFLVNNESSLNNFNLFGKECLKNHYLGRNKNEIEKFFSHIIINGNDSMFDDRKSFVKRNYISPNNNSASKNIFNYLKKTFA